LEIAIRPKNVHYPELTLICVENTHNRNGGTIITPNQLKTISEVAKKHSIKVYMDGARIFNAAVGLGVDPKDFTKHVDNLMFCLSKGLSCPVGSLIVGSQEFIEKARKIRKILGGGMRQAGIIAAPGIIALERMTARLKTDHENAKLLAEALSKISGIQIDTNKIQTNIVTFNLTSSAVEDFVFIQELKENGILGLTQAKNKVRLVTHMGIEKEHIEKTVVTIEKILTKPRHS
jgi:threonine aldolase